MGFPCSQRTKADWAQEVAAPLDGRYEEYERVTLVCDNLGELRPMLAGWVSYYRKSEVRNTFEDLDQWIHRM